MTEKNKLEVGNPPKKINRSNAKKIAFMLFGC